MKMRELALIASVLLGFVQTVAAQEEVAPAEETGVEATTEMSTTEAPAEESSAAGGEEKKLSAALLLGYGLDLSDKTMGINPYGLGFGVRGGYKVTPEIYLGAQFVYFLGGSEEIPLGPFGTFEASFNFMSLMVEAGYDVAMSDTFTLRPIVGLGLTFAGGDGSGSDFTLAPGAVGLLDVADDIFVGLDVRLPVVLAGSTLIGLTFLATAGMSF